MNTTLPTPKKAAALLGCKPDEIDSVADSPAGIVIATSDGTGYIVVPDDEPDGEDKSGLMLLAAPSDAPLAVVGGESQWNGFPVYVSPEPLTDDDEPNTDAEATDPNSPPTNPPDVEGVLREDLGGRGIDELRDMARERKLDVPMNAKEPIIDALVAHTLDADGG